MSNTEVSNNIPIVVGVTGHRDLRKEDISALEKAVLGELQKIQREYPNSPIWMLNSLAAGADQLCARVALSLQIPLYCPLPMPEDEYRNDFSVEESKEYQALRSKAADVFVVPYSEEQGEGRDYLYRQAGIYVAAHSHVLLALWDGKHGSAQGFGTAETVDFMLKGNDQDGNMFRAANDGAVIHVATPRVSKEQEFPVTVSLLENQTGSLRVVLEKTDRFNRDVRNEKLPDGELLLPPEYLHHTVSNRLQNVYDAADQLSMKWQRHYLKILGVLAVFSVILVLLYLLYDEADLYTCLIGYGGAIFLYALFYRLIARRRQHEKYLQYRALAEALRVQLYLYALGGRECVCDDFTWTQKHDATWVKSAVYALLIGTPQEEIVPTDVVKKVWIDGQRAYHERAGRRDAGKHRAQELATRAMLTCTIVLWLSAFVLEYFFRDTMAIVLFGLTLRAWIKILWGSLSAVTVFVSGYYGKQSLARKSFDHEKMKHLFASAALQYDLDPQSRMELFRQLGREELIENGNWVSYCRENTPDFSV
ncbi:MAG TPA: hypothetical protein PL100_05555 [Bacillota bacterium]|jgi:putative sterol carrier protein|nr:hypothetical protein [Bacillota bacterium]HQC48971.1 hypothetical protein [Bacillota bacterium]